MMNRLFKLYFLLVVLIGFSGLNAGAQTPYFFVKGKVIDLNTGGPLAGASVFAENTTLGGVTNEEGEYKIWLPDGGYSLVVTFTGYETDITRVSRSIAQEGNVNFELKEKVKALEEINIVMTNEVANGWEKYGNFFTDNFIGRSKFGKQCVIKNSEALQFFFSKKRNQLKVLSKEPLVVENYALGYVIKFAIDSFLNNYNNHSILFTGQPLFEEMVGTAEEGSKWAANRAETYKGSMLHFMRSFYARDLKENGFEIQFIINRKGEEVPLRVGDTYGALNYALNDSLKTVQFKPNQPVVALIYNKEKPEANYLASDTTIKAKTFQLSTLAFPKNTAVTIEQNGYYYDQQDITTNGYLSFKKVGDMLPYNYGIAEVARPAEDNIPEIKREEMRPADSTNEALIGNDKIVITGQESSKENNEEVSPGEKIPVTLPDIKKLLEEMEMKNYSEKELAELKQILIKFMAEKGK